MTTEDKIEKERETWMRIAKERDWYTWPFYVQVWFSPAGEVWDSVSFRGMTEDIIIEDYVENDEEYDFLD
jgi:hypothetical protein